MSQQIPTQQQDYPGRTEEMTPRPRDEMSDYRGSGLLAGKRALVTGGDSGIGRAVAVAFAKEGADVAVAYLSEDDDAEHTRQLIEQAGRRCVLIGGDLGTEQHCRDVVARCVEELGGLDVLVNHAGTQAPQDSIEKISTEQWERTFAVNVTSMFWVTKYAVPHLSSGSAIVNTGSINGERGNRHLIDYSATKGAVHAFTYAMAQSLVHKGIRVNCVAPGPVWTPLIPSTFPPEHVEKFGQNQPMKRPAEPDEIAPSYVFFAADRLSSYYTGELLAPTGGEIQVG